MKHFYKRRLFPQISISKSMFSKWGKTYALLWLCFLICGPSYVRMRAFHGCIKAFCTDLGTEKDVCDAPDCLLEFLKAIKVHVPVSATRQPYLFANALLLCGWHHLYDSLIRYGLCSMAWFAGFLNQLKVLVKFCRDHSSAIADIFEQRKLNAVATMIRKIPHTTFAAWRWRKLWKVCRGVGRFFAILTSPMVFDVVIGYVRNSSDRERSWRTTVLVVLRCETFKWRFKFVWWFSQRLTAMESWGSSCWCHQDEWRAGVEFQCIHRGRLLPYAFQYLCDAFDAMMTEVSEWCVGEWDNNHAFLSQISGATRATIARGRLKTIFIDRLPYIICHLGFVAGAREKIMEQFRSAPRDRHNRVTLQLCTDGTDMHDAMMRMASFDDRSDPSLRLFVQSIRDSPLNDEVGEGPHARFAREHQHCNRSTFAWKSASIRLEQNLTDIYDLAGAADVDLQESYDNYKMCVRTSPHLRPPRMTRRKYEQRFYHCDIIFEPDVADVVVDDHVGAIVLFASRLLTYTSNILYLF